MAKITLKENATVSKETVTAALKDTKFKITRFEENRVIPPGKKKLNRSEQE
jgi:hypothetical protein